MQPSTTVRVCVCVCVFFFYNWHRGTDPHPNPNPGRRSSWVNVDCRVWRCVSVSEDLLHLVTLQKDRVPAGRSRYTPTLLEPEGGRRMTVLLPLHRE